MTKPVTIPVATLATMLLMLSTITLTACGAEQKPATTPAQVEKTDKVNKSDEMDATKATATTDSNQTNIGKTLYENNCQMCHGQGIAGAPKLADKPAWKHRIAKGKEALYISVLHGAGGMPARGTADDASDEDIKAAVDYMIANSQ